MDSGVDIPFCLPPWERPSDVVPMLVVLSVFLLVGSFIQRWKKKRNAKKRTH